MSPSLARQLRVSITRLLGTSDLPLSMLTASQLRRPGHRPPTPQDRQNNRPDAVQLHARDRQRISRHHRSQHVYSFLPWQRQQQPTVGSATAPANEQPSSPPAQLVPVEAVHNAATSLRGRQAAATPGVAGVEPAPIISGSGGGIFFFWQLGALHHALMPAYLSESLHASFRKTACN